MRRPRYKLQVSTFPFLAVLLCAMGSLLLFLFIMDRRAKIAAQHANDEVLQARKRRTKDEEDALQADWEKAKEQLHQAMLLQQGELAAQAQGLQIDLDSVGKKLHILQAQHLNLDEQAKGEAAKIAEIQFQITGRRAGLLKADKEETMSKKELIAAARELAELEIAFQQLLALKEREKQVHSLVPYHGKRGDSRTPIYIECVRDAVIFHPEDRILQGYEFAPGAIRVEVERRAGSLTVAKASDDKLPAQDKKGVYVLFLVRPSGIGSYYRAQSALKGYRLDFGYELIDQDWELDFGGTGYVKNRPVGVPAKRTEMPIDNRPMIEPLTPIYAGAGGPGPLPPSGGGPPATGFGPGPGGVPGFGGGSGAAGIGAPIGSGASAGGGSGGPGKGPAFVPLNKILPPVPIASTEGPGGGSPGYPGGGTRPYPPGGAPGGSTGPYPPGGTSYPGGGTGSYPPGGTPYPGGGTGPYPSGGTPNPGGGAGPYPTGGTPNPGGGAGPYPPGVTPYPGGGAGPYPPGGTPNPNGNTGSYPPGGTPYPPGGTPNPSGNGGVGTGQYPSGSGTANPNGGAGAPATGNSNANGDGPATGNPNAGGQNPSAGTPSPGNTNAGGAAAKNPSPGSPAPDGATGTANANGKPSEPGASGFGGSANGGSGNGGVEIGPPPLLPFGPGSTAKKPAATPVMSKILGNKDFIITVDCYDDHVNVFPGGMSFRWTVANMKTTDQAFARAVANLIERRQASVRAGEPPYRPLICFRVTPDGRPSCLHVYPLLEPLHVPMTRENVVE